jgi:curved DNA-binding protein CbpA
MEHIALYLKDIHFNEKSGCLTFKREALQNQFFFLDGFLIIAQTNIPQEKLGEILFKLGKISERTYSMIQEYVEPKQKIGEILIQKGQVKQKDVYEALMYQSREIVLNIFPFFDGEFSFQEEREFDEQQFESRISIPVIIEEGIRRMAYDPSLEKFMAEKVPFPKKRDFIYRLTKEEKEALAKIDGEASAEELLSSSGSRPELFWKNLYLFYCLSLVAFNGEEEISEKKEEAEQVFPEVREPRIAEVLELSEKLPNLDYYQILNVERTAPQEEIKKVYFELARKYHPDSFDRNLPPDITKKIADVFDHIAKAYQTLSTEEKRKGYEPKRASTLAQARRERERTADTKFRQGKTLFNLDRFEEALILLEEAVRLNPRKGTYFLLLAMAQSKLATFRRKAEKSFLKAQELEPWNAESYVGLGLLYKEEGLYVKARKQFKRALGIDSAHKIALKELNLTGKGEKKGLKGIFSFIRSGKKRK